jgi:tRNA pseudouridine55 synthase
VDKPAGITSTSVVNKGRNGHWMQKPVMRGMDPDATGVLAVALGEATKLFPTSPTRSRPIPSACVLVKNQHRRCRGRGDCQRQAPTTTKSKPSSPSLSAISCRTPPLFSAVKIDGERAYKRQMVKNSKLQRASLGRTVADRSP